MGEGSIKRESVKGEKKSRDPVSVKGKEKVEQNRERRDVRYEEKNKINRRKEHHNVLASS